MSLKCWETERQWCGSLGHHAARSPRRPASPHAPAHLFKTGASRPCSQTFPQPATAATLPFSCGGGVPRRSLQSVIWDPGVAED